MQVASVSDNVVDALPLGTSSADAFEVYTNQHADVFTSHGPRPLHKDALIVSMIASESAGVEI